MFRPNRDQPAGEDKWLIPKIFFFVAGAAFGITGMATGNDWPVTVGLLLLICGWILRFATNRVNPPAADTASTGDGKPATDEDEPAR